MDNGVRMLDRAAALPAQIREGWGMGLSWSAVPSSWSRLQSVAVLGMGGSAIGADLLQNALLDDLPKPVFVNRTYTIPRWIGRETLVLASSYSGNTEETLSAVESAARRGAKIAAVTSGGRLAEWASRRRLPLLLIPAGMPPRAAVGYMAFIPLGLFTRLGWLRKGVLPVEKSCVLLQGFVESRLVPEAPARKNPARGLAEELAGRLPVIYGASPGWDGVAYRWRTQLEENAKTLAFHHIFPEATHNEISGWVQPRALMRKTAAIFLTDRSIHPRTRRRMLFTAGIVRRQGAEVFSVGCEERGFPPLARLLGVVAIGDFASVYLALRYRIDPAPVVRVEQLKKFMKKGSDPSSR